MSSLPSLCGVPTPRRCDGAEVRHFIWPISKIPACCAKLESTWKLPGAGSAHHSGR